MIRSHRHQESLFIGADYLYGFKAARRAARAASSDGSVALPLRSRVTGLCRRLAGAKVKTGPREPGKSRSRGGFDTGTPRGGSIGLTRPTWEGRPIAGKRTAAAPV